MMLLFLLLYPNLSILYETPTVAKVDKKNVLLHKQDVKYYTNFTAIHLIFEIFHRDKVKAAKAKILINMMSF